MRPDGYQVRPAVASDLPLLAGIEVAAGELFRTVGMDDIAGDEGMPSSASTSMPG